MLLQVLEKIERSLQKGKSKVIADAERHRRTPWTLAVESKMIEGMKSAGIGDAHGGRRRNLRGIHLNIGTTLKIYPKLQ